MTSIRGQKGTTAQESYSPTSDSSPVKMKEDTGVSYLKKTIETTYESDRDLYIREGEKER